MGLTMEAAEARRNYQREYRRKNRDKINNQRKNWRAENRDKVRQYNWEYWERKAEKKKNIRASWEAYGISPERLDELMMVVISGEYEAMVFSAAHRANETLAEYILLSIKKNLSYEGLEKLWGRGEIERIPYGRTDFYGARRLFFHYLDCTLKEVQEINGVEALTQKLV